MRFGTEPKQIIKILFECIDIIPRGLHLFLFRIDDTNLFGFGFGYFHFRIACIEVQSDIVTLSRIWMKIAESLQLLENALFYDICICYKLHFKNKMDTTNEYHGKN